MKYLIIGLVAFLTVVGVVQAQALGAECSIQAQPQAVFSGDSVTITLSSTNVFSPIVFEGKEYQSGSVISLKPSSTTTYTASIKDGRACTNTVVVVPVSPVTASAATVVAPVSAQSTGEPAAAATSPEQTVCVSDVYKRNDRDEQIKVIQQFLQAQGYTKVSITGVYDMYTERAVSHFQNEHRSAILTPAGLGVATGTWGYFTARKASEMGLCSLDAQASGEGSPIEDNSVCYALPITPGERSEAVRSIQKFLRAEGYTKVEVTGYYGLYTKRAVAHFQNEYKKDILSAGGYSAATGVWGPHTARKASERGLCAY